MASRATTSRWTGDAILFDLFGTVVHFAPHVPAVPVGGATRRTTMSWLGATAERELPEVAFADLSAAVLAVTEEVIRARPPEFLEVPSRERFRRALSRVGVDGPRGADLAETLSLAHMGHLASLTELPAGYADVLGAVAARYRIGLVSNFDHGPTARRILATHGIERCFDVVVISDELGRRKPHPAIFQEAVARLGCAPAATLFVGDSATEDVVGARQAGLSVAWINPRGEPLPDGVPEPELVVESLHELARLVA